MSATLKRTVSGADSIVNSMVYGKSGATNTGEPSSWHQTPQNNTKPMRNILTIWGDSRQECRNTARRKLSTLRTITSAPLRLHQRLKRLGAVTNTPYAFLLVTTGTGATLNSRSVSTRMPSSIGSVPCEHLAGTLRPILFNRLSHVVGRKLVHGNWPG